MTSRDIGVRRREAVPVTVSTGIARDQAGQVIGLRRLLVEPPTAGAFPTQEPTPSAPRTSPSLLAELVTSRPAAAQP
jgi:hypothetical protein